MFKQILAFSLLLILWVSISEAEDRLNVLFIAVDDMNCDLSIYGKKEMPMPNLQRLANLGIRFNRAYCQQPLCGPSRASLMTGLRPDTLDMHDLKHDMRKKNPDVVTLGQMFRQNGYYSARVGKIYHYNNPGHIGTDGNDDPDTWDERFNPAGIDKKQEDKIVRYSPHSSGLGRSLSVWDPVSNDEEHTDGLVAKKIVELIERKQDQPFFLAAGFYRPHCPYVAPKKYFDQFPLEKISMPDRDKSKIDLFDVPPVAITQDSKNWPYFFPDISTENARRCKQAYFACNAFLDIQIGKILDALERCELLDKTIVVFWSDHGYFLGEKGLWFKRKAFERAARVPLIISAPNMQKKAVANQTVELVDLYPTLADLCRLDPPKELEGNSLRAILEDPENAVRENPAITQVYYHKNAWGYSIRTGRFRYTEWKEGYSGIELYDHQSDPDETHNLAYVKEQQATVRELSDRLKPFVSLKSQKRGGKPIVVTHTYSADMKTVWQAITDVNQMKKWYFESLENFEPTLGFKTEFTVDVDSRKIVHVWELTRSMAPYMLEYKWSYWGIPGKSKVSWHLQPVEGGTKLTLRHHGVETFDQSDPMFNRASAKTGWNLLITENLKNFLENRNR